MVAEIPSTLEGMEESFRSYALSHMLQYVEKDRGDGIKEWHVICYNDGQTIAVATRGKNGYTWKVKELLTLVLAHLRQCHEELMGQ